MIISETGIDFYFYIKIFLTRSKNMIKTMIKNTLKVKTVKMLYFNVILFPVRFFQEKT